MGARYYDPVTTRFTQTDPSGQENNPYAALGNNPVNNTDPNGTFGIDSIPVVGDAIDITEDVGDGGIDKAFSDTRGLIAGAAAWTGCETVLAVGAPEAGGSDEVAGQSLCWGMATFADGWERDQT
jgi:hypothetical protein